MNEKETTQIGSSLAGLFLQHSLDRGNVITIPSLDIKITKISAAFPTNLSSIREVIEGFSNLFPFASITTFPPENPHQVIARIPPDDSSQIHGNTYVAVDEVGSVPHAHMTDEKYLVTNGELVVTKRGPIYQCSLEPEQILYYHQKLTMSAGLVHSLRAKTGWAIFHLSAPRGFYRGTLPVGYHPI